ncbi:MAG: alpha/beta fold hydrolase [Burkholderiaceae bacterium]|nr:alpha/beta fold hydrolase [Burkholderiaceae bacterium]
MAALVIGGLAACDDDTPPGHTAPAGKPAVDSRASANETAVTTAPLLSVGTDKAPPLIDTLRDYRNQTVQWGACDPSILGDRHPIQEPLFDKLGPRLQCAQYRVAKDYSNVGHGDMSIGVMRLAAADPKKRQGALVFNPGGPGGDGLAFALNLPVFAAFSDSDPDDKLGSMQLRLLDEYDMIGFSPRGTGISTRFDCASNERLHFIDESVDGAKPENLAKRDYNGKKTAQACQKDPNAPFINSNAIAQDMDVLRSILGDEKLNYLGYSHGTWLGARYASMFPERIGRMVLIGLTDVTAPMEKSFSWMPRARQRLLTDWLIPYAIRNPDSFGLGVTSESILTRLEALDTQMQHVLGNYLAVAGYKRGNADDYLLAINAASVLQGFINTSYASDPQQRFSRFLASSAARRSTFVPNNFEHDARARQIASELHDRYTGVWGYDISQRRSISSANVNGTYWAIRCNDSPAIQDVAEVHRLARVAWNEAPLFGGVVASTICAHWGGPSVPTPDLAAMKDLSVLLVHSQFDTATAMENAEATFAALPNAHLLTIPREFDHGIYPYKDRCVDQSVVDFLLGQNPLSKRFTCAARPLPQDVKRTVARAGMMVHPAVGTDADSSIASSAPQADDSMRAYKNPAAAGALIDSFQAGLASSIDTPLQHDSLF